VTNPIVDPLIGRTVAHYEILARLGGGGMGVVYQARDTRLGRVVALKFLPQQWSHDEDAKQRFIREAQAASATDHRNICTIHDIGTADDGQLFIVMAYYEGVTLKQRLDVDGALAIDEALDIATQVAEGLARAHAQGVVHRDIKPGNLILAEDGVRILDFGLATFANALQLTIVGSTLGTAAYMSPEQVRGDTAGPASDVWAVGAILYQMLAGHVPFQGAYAEAIAYAIKNETPAPLREKRPEIPEEVEQLVFRALHKDASVRYATGRELARALRQVRGQTVPMDLRTEAVDAPQRLAQLAPAPAKRRSRKPLLAVAATLLLALAGGGAWVMWPVERVPIVVVPIANQTGFSELDPYRRALTHVIVEELADSPVVRPLSWPSTLQALRGFIERAEDISSREAVQALTVATSTDTLILPTIVHEGGSWFVRIDVRDGRTGTTRRTYQSAPQTSSLRLESAYRLAFAAVPLIETHFRGNRRFSWREPAPRARPATIDAARAAEDGVSWYEEQEYGQAARAFAKAVALDASNPLYWAWSSRAARVLRQAADAVRAANEATKLLAADAPPVDRLFVEALAAEARRDNPTADARYASLVDEFADDPRWVLERAGYLERKAEDRDGWSAAVAAYRQALDGDAKATRPHLELCSLYNRLQETAIARQEGEAALAAYVQSGWKAGEALARLCLTGALRAGTDKERQEADKHVQAAYRILQDAGHRYNLSRAMYLRGLVSGERGALREAIAFWEEAAAAAEASGNAVLRPIILNNLGAAHHRLGRGSVAADYYAQSVSGYEQLGDEARAARQRFNGAFLRISYGIGATAAVKDVENALAVVKKNGDPEFEVACLEAMAIQYRHLGRYDDAERLLNQAYSLAQQWNLDQKQVHMTLELGRLHIDTSNYVAAKQRLEPLITSQSGRNRTQARVLLGRVHTRLGQFAAADDLLRAALADVEASDDAGLRPIVHEALGELYLESGRVADARRHFETAAPFGEDMFVDPAAVESMAHVGWLDVLTHQPAAGLPKLQASLTHASRTDRPALETRVAVLLSRAYVALGRLDAGREVLSAVSQEDVLTLGPELRAQVYYWRFRTRQDSGPSTDEHEARRLLEGVTALLPEDSRQAFLERPDVRLVVNDPRPPAKQ
jgi:hypothetical protein